MPPPSTMTSGWRRAPTEPRLAPHRRSDHQRPAPEGCHVSEEKAMPFDFESLREAYHDDGVVFLEQALDADALRLAEAAFNWSVSHPGPAHGRPFEGSPGEFYQ